MVHIIPEQNHDLIGIFIAKNRKVVITMKEVFPCGLFQPPGIKVFGVEDGGVIYGKETFAFNRITWLNLATAPTPLTNGVAQMMVDGKIYQLVYKFADRERAAAAINFAKEKIETVNGTVKDYKYRLAAHTGTTLEVYDSYVILNFMRTGGLGTVTANIYSGGATGGKRINFSDITAIQFKEPAGVTVGFIQFAYPGSGEFRGSVADAINDENSIPVSPQNFALAKEIIDFIESKRSVQRAPQPAAVQQVSAADELTKFKSLLDAGVITQEEFDAKKKQLLGL